MFYLIDNGEEFADIGFGAPENDMDNVIEVFDREYDDNTLYRILPDGYEEVLKDPDQPRITSRDLREEKSALENIIFSGVNFV